MMTSPFLANALSSSAMPGALSGPFQSPGAPSLAPQIPLLPNAGRGGIGPDPHLPPGPQPPAGPFSSLLNDPMKLAQLFRIMFPGGPSRGPTDFGSLVGTPGVLNGAAGGPGALAGFGLLPDSGAVLAGGSALDELGPLAFAGLF